MKILIINKPLQIKRTIMGGFTYLSNNDLSDYKKYLGFTDFRYIYNKRKE